MHSESEQTQTPKVVKSQYRRTLPAICLAVLCFHAKGGEASADFNDMYLGDTRTYGESSSLNLGNVNSGIGFAPDTGSGDGGPGEYNNATGVVQFEKGDLTSPVGVLNFNNTQGTPKDSNASGVGGGVVFGSGNNAVSFSRMQERRFANPITGGEIWFSFLFRLDGPSAQGQVFFNAAPTVDAAASAGAFGVSMGHSSTPGAVALNLDPTQSPADLIGQPQLLFYNGTKGVEVKDPAAIKAHLIIGRVTNNVSGSDKIDIWLDPADAMNPGSAPPTLTYSGNKLGTEGLFSVAFEGTRFEAPNPAGGPYSSGGHVSIDQFRISDEVDALAFVTGNIEDEQKLIVSADSPASNFNFRAVYGPANPVISSPLTVKLLNNGSVDPINITSINFATPTDTFVVTNGPSLPATLAPGESVTITVQATSSVFETSFTNSLIVETEAHAQDLELNTAAIFYSNGSRVNQNHTFDLNTTGWVTDDSDAGFPPLRVTPGLRGTVGMVQMKGTHYLGNMHADNFSQIVPAGAKDWELNFAFSPMDPAAFPEIIGDVANPGDRTFQLFIQADGNVPVPASGTNGHFTIATNANAALINLAYMPADGGFCVFNGSNWEPVGLPEISGYYGDGTTAGTTYFVRIRGKGFGTSLANYSISVLNVGTVENLTTFSSANGHSHTPSAYTFTTGDTSNSGPWGENGKRTTFFIDDVSYFSGEARDPDFFMAVDPVIKSHNGVPIAGQVRITNTGFTQNLVVNTLNFSIPSVFSTSQALPITIPPGATHAVPVNVASSGFVGADNSGYSLLTAVTNVPFQPSQSISVLGVATTRQNLLGNWNFETSGVNLPGVVDPFAVWVEHETPLNVKKVPGLAAESTSSIHLASGAGVRNPLGDFTSDFVLEATFAVKNHTGRAFNLILFGNGGNLNLRYQQGKWEAYQDAWNPIIDMTSAPLATATDENGNFSLNDAGDTKVFYKMRLTGNGWGSAGTAVYHLEIFDAEGVPVASSLPGTAFFQFGRPVGGMREVMLVDAHSGPNGGFWMDDIRVSMIVESEITVTGLSGGPGSFSISWNSEGKPVTVERSFTLLPDSWTPVSVSDSDGQFIDSVMPPNGRAFYRLRYTK